MATRGVVGACLMGICGTGIAAAQIVVLGPPVSVVMPAPIPVLVNPLPAAIPVEGQPRPDGQAATEQRNYPAGQTQPERRFSPGVVHERHFLSPNMNVSNYLSTKSEPTYGPETRVVIRDFYITDEPPKSTGTAAPPPVGTTDDQRSSRSANEGAPPRNSTSAEFDRMLNNESSSRSGTTGSGINVPSASAADTKNGAGSSPSGTRANYPAENETPLGPPTPPQFQTADVTTTVAVASRNGGTPMAEMELNFVDLAGKHQDVKGRTDVKGRFEAKLAPSRWHVFLVIGDDERRSLGVILVKPTPGEPFKLQF